MCRNFGRRYFFGLELSENLLRAIARFEAMTQQTPVLTRHTTLVPPGSWNSLEEGEIIRRAEQALRGVRPFMLEVGNKAEFFPGDRVLKLPVRRTDQLLTLHMSLAQELGISPEDQRTLHMGREGYSPHATIMKSLSGRPLERKHRLVSWARVCFRQPETFLVTHVCLYAKVEGRTYKVIQRFLLG